MSAASSICQVRFLPGGGRFVEHFDLTDVGVLLEFPSLVFRGDLEVDGGSVQVKCTGAAEGHALLSFKRNEDLVVSSAVILGRDDKGDSALLESFFNMCRLTATALGHSRTEFATPPDRPLLVTVVWPTLAPDELSTLGTLERSSIAAFLKCIENP